MENVTIISMHAAYGLAAILFLGVAAKRAFASPRDPNLPPPLPIGNIKAGLYQWLDVLVVGVIVGFYYLMILLGSMMAEGDEKPQITAPDLIFNIGLQFFLAGLVTAMVVGRIRPALWLGLRWKDWPWVALIAPATVLTVWAAFAGLYAMGYHALIESLGVEMVQDTVNLFQTTQDMNVLILMAFTAVIVAPICEEVVFRGYIYPVLKRFSGPWVGALVSALVFSAAHGSLAALLPLFIFGLVLVFLYEWTGSIWAPIAAHFLFNGATVAIQLLVRFGYIPESALQ